MKPAPFEYVRPTTLPETLEVLASRGGAAKVLAGGQSLIPAMNFRVARPTCLVDINALTELSFVRVEDGLLRIGALVRHRAIERSRTIADSVPLMTEAAPFIGYPAVRNRGTIGGSLAYADPAAEWPTVASALEAVCVVARSGEERQVSVDELIAGPLTTTLGQSELLTEIRIPIPGPRAGYSYAESSRRYGGIAIVGAAVALNLNPNGSVAAVRIAFAGAGPRPIRARRAEEALAGESPTEALIHEVADQAAGETEPVSDVHATADYRRHLAGVLCRRGLERALERARAAR